MSTAKFSEELEEWIVNHLTRLGVAIPKLKKVKSQVYKQNHKVPQGKVFGVMLSQQLSHEQDENETIPKFLLDATSFLNPHLDHNCLFRKRGQDSRIKQLRAKIEAGGSLDDSVFVDDVATLIKAWLRELPVPVIPNEFHDLILGCHKLCVEGKSTMPLLLACSLLPTPHLDTLKFILNFLARVAKNSVANGMDSKCLAIVFCPNLIRGNCKLMKGEKTSAHVLNEKELKERCALQWLIDHAEDVSKLPKSVQLLASVSNSTEEDVLTRKKRRKSMTGFTELVGCKIKKMVTNQEKTPSISNSSRRKSFRKSQRTKGKLFVQNCDGKKPVEVNLARDTLDKIPNKPIVEATLPLRSCVLSNEPNTVEKHVTTVEINFSKSPVTRSHSFKKIQMLQLENNENFITGSTNLLESKDLKKLPENDNSQLLRKLVVRQVEKCGRIGTPVNRSQSMLKPQTSRNTRQSTSTKRRSKSETNIFPAPPSAENFESDGFQEWPQTPSLAASEVAFKLARLHLNSTLKGSGSLNESKLTKSATLKRGRPNTVKTGLSLTRKPKLRSNSTVAYVNRDSMRKTKVTRRSRSSTNFTISEIDSSIDKSDLSKLSETSHLIVETEKENGEVKKKLDFSNSFDFNCKNPFESEGNIMYCSLGFSPVTSQNTEGSLNSLLNDNCDNLETEAEDLKKMVESNSPACKSSIELPLASPIEPARLRRTRSKTAMSSTPANASHIKWQEATEFNFSKSREDNDSDVYGSKRDSIIKLREMNAGKVLASVHLYNQIEKTCDAKPSPSTKIATFERNSISSKSVRERKELFKDAQGFLIPGDFPSSIKRPTTARILSRTPDSPLPRNWHKKKNASADLLYVI